MHSQVAPPRRALRINMDETAVRYFQDARRGMLTAAGKRQLRTPRSLRRPATRGETRSMLSLMTFVCDDAEVQVALPQIVVVNAKLLPLRELGPLLALLPPGVELWREAKCWTTTLLMKRALKLLRRNLEPWLESRQVILSVDGYRAHITRAIWRWAAACGFYYLLIPARMTWALQPCDTHLFGAFKRSLEEEAQAAAARSPDGRLSRADLMGALFSCVRVFLRERSWRKAFEDTGLIGSQHLVTERTLNKLGMACLPEVGSGLPTLQMLQDTWPRGAHIPLDDVFAAFMPRPIHRPAVAIAHTTPRPRLRPRPDSPADTPVWHGRLRSSSAQNLDEGPPPESPAASAVAPPCPAPPATANATTSGAAALPRRYPVGRPLFLPALRPARPAPPPPRATSLESRSCSRGSRS